MKGGQERRRGHRNGGIWFQTMVLGAERTGPLDADLDTDLSPDTRPGPSTAPAASAADEPVRPFVRRGSQAPPAAAETPLQAAPDSPPRPCSEPPAPLLRLFRAFSIARLLLGLLLLGIY